MATLLAEPADRVLGWFWATVRYIYTDSAASYWCFYVSFYAAFVLVYAAMVSDDTSPQERA